MSPSKELLRLAEFTSGNSGVGPLVRLDRPTIERIVRAASLAPSAENNQPWHFLAHDGQITVYLDERRGLGSDVDRMFDLTAVGAAIENATIAARQEGHDLQVSLLRDEPAENGHAPLVPVALLASHGAGAADPLHAFLHERCTCRTLLAGRAIPPDQLERLSAAAAEFEDVRVHWITERARLRELAHLVALGDRIRFEFPPFQNEFFENVRFTPDEVEKTRDGLDVRTLDLPLGGVAALKFLRHLWLLRVGNRVGLSHLLVGPSRQWIRRAPAVGILTVTLPDKERFVRGGRGLERLWLTATSAGLGIHPIGSLPIFMAYAERTNGARLEPRHLRMSRNIAERLRLLMPEVTQAVVLLAFRVGVAHPPRFRSMRLPVERVLRFPTT